jgi:hypothetical protein
LTSATNCDYYGLVEPKFSIVLSVDDEIGCFLHPTVEPPKCGVLYDPIVSFFNMRVSSLHFPLTKTLLEI